MALFRPLGCQLAGAIPAYARPDGRPSGRSSRMAHSTPAPFYYKLLS